MSGRIEAAIERAAVGFEVLSCWSTYPDGSCRCPKGKDCDRKPGKHPIAPNGSWGETRDPERRGHRTLVDLCAQYGIDIVQPHDATADAIASLEVLFSIADRCRELEEADLLELHCSQIAWHREWVERQDEWRVSRELLPFDPREYVWPVAPAVMPRVA